MADTTVMDKLTSLAKRRGFIFQSSEIYGGTGSVWDYGPLGIELKRNVKERWWTTMVHQRADVEGLDASNLMHPKVWEASGHVEGFTDPLVECSNCHRRFRADLPEVEGGQCPVCGTKDSFGEARLFNLMFKTFMGPVEDDASVVFLRPETAQGSYVNFLNVQTAARQKIPFGIAQIGKAFRNEITPGNFIFRTREFEQMELQFFVEPGSDDEWFDYWMNARLEWHLSLGIRKEKLRFHEHGPDELAHYAKKAFDIEYEFPFGWKEFEGIHNPHGLRPRSAPGVLRQATRVYRPCWRQALRALRGRNGGGSGSYRAGGTRGRVHRGGGRRRGARPPEARCESRADQSGGVPVGEKGWPPRGRR